MVKKGGICFWSFFSWYILSIQFETTWESHLAGPLMWVLGSKFWIPDETVNTFNHWAVFLTPELYFLRKLIYKVRWQDGVSVLRKLKDIHIELRNIWELYTTLLWFRNLTQGKEQESPYGNPLTKIIQTFYVKVAAVRMERNWKMKRGFKCKLAQLIRL